MSLKEKINKLFPTKTFLMPSDSTINNENDLIKGENAIFVVPKIKDELERYSDFYKQLYDYLPKVTNDKIKTIVKDLLDRDLIFIGSASYDPNSPTRLLINANNKLAGIILNIYPCGINIKDFKSKNPLLCIYMIYYGFLRSIIIINKEQISKEYQLHELAAGYIYVLFIKYFGKNSFLTEKQKSYLKCACLYIYYAHYFKLKHNNILATINLHHYDIVNSEFLESFMIDMKPLNRFTNIKELPSLLIDLKITNETPNSITIGILKTLKTNGYFSFTGYLDMFLSFIVVSKYPVDQIFNVEGILNNKINNAIEDILLEYSKKIKYAIGIIPTDEIVKYDSNNG